MPDQCLLDGDEPLFECAIREQFLSHLDECAHNINTHGHGSLAVKHGRGHDGAVLGEHPRQILPVLPASLLQGHNL